jgi:hypothetical protein
MKLPHRRQFLHLAAGAAALPVVSRIAFAQASAWRRSAGACKISGGSKVAMSTSRSAGQAGITSACEASLPNSWGCGRMLFSPAMGRPQLLDVRKPEDVVRAFDTAIAQRTDAILVGNDSVTLTNRWRVVELAAKHRLPAIYNNRGFIDAGGLMAYGVSYPDLYRRAAIFVDKIFKVPTRPICRSNSRPNSSW